MAPEQALARGAPIGPAADVYSLGVILYELIAGRAPFVGDSPLEVMLQARHDEPLPPSRLRHRLPRDLEIICLKCLEKEPGSRYASADALAGDLRRFLADEPIKARPVGAIGRAARWVRKRPAEATLWATLALVVLLGAAGVGWQWWRAEANAKQAESNAEQAGHDRDAALLAEQKEAESLNRHRIIRAYDEWMSDNAHAARELLRDATSRRDTWEGRYVNRLCHLGRHVFEDHEATVTGVAFTPDGRYLISADRGGIVLVRDLVDGKTDRIIVGGDRPEDLNSLSLNPADSRFLAVGAASGFVHVVDLRERKVVAGWKAHELGSSHRVAYSPDGRSLATAATRSLKVWDVGQPKPTRTIAIGAWVIQIAWSKDGRYVAASSHSRLVRIWDVVTGERRTLPTVTWQANCVSYSPDGRRFAWSGMDGIVAVHDSATFERVATLAGLPGYQTCTAFSPDGRFIAAGSKNGPVKIWNVETGQLVRTLHGHSSGVQELTFSPDGSQLATVGADRHVIVWDILDEQEVSTLLPITPGKLFAAAFSPDSRYMATAVRQVRLWDLKRGELLFSDPPVTHEELYFSVAFHPSGERFAAGDATGRVRVFTTGGRVIASREMKGAPLALAFVDGGRRLLVAGLENSVCAWDPESEEEPKVLAGPIVKDDRPGIKADFQHAALSADGRWLAYADRAQPAALWDLAAGGERYPLADTPRVTSVLAFDRSGERLAVGGSRGEIRLFDVVNRSLTAMLVGHPREITGLAFTPDGTRLASAAGDGVVKLWDTQTNLEVLSLRGQATFDTAVAFSPDGETCVAGGWEGFLRLWSVKDPQVDFAEAREARRKAWHEVQAADATKARNLFAARQNLDQLVDLDPGRWELRHQRGKAFAELGNWPAAETDFDAALANPACSLAAHGERALLFLRAGDAAGYRRLCGQMLERFDNDPNPARANDLAWYCAMAANSEVPPERLVALAERAVSRGATPTQRSYFAGTLGSALYRAGRYEEAIKRLDECETEGAYFEDWLFLAMAHHKLGHAAKAKEYLDRAGREVQSAKTGAVTSDGRTLTWRVRMELELFYQAKSTLGKSP
jgi:WD40 repeat protein/tetratricopeptide (TPR) repeat protein